MDIKTATHRPTYPAARDLVAVETLPSADAERWQTGLLLVGQWLREQGQATRAGYADSIGWPYTTTGTPRSYHATRHGVTWLAWCYDRGVHLLDASRDHVLAWVDEINGSRHPVTGEPLSKRSKAHMVSAVSSFYTWSVEEGHVNASPVQFNRAKKGLNTSRDRSPSRSLSETEAARMVTAADNDPIETVQARTAAIIAVVFITGIRASEVCTPTLADLRIQNGRRILHINVKGHKEHNVPLPPAVWERIDRYLRSRADCDRLPALVGRAGGRSVPLFTTSRGKPMNRREVLRLVKRVAVLAEIEHPESVYTHVGRHSVITELRRLKVADSDIQRIVGHAHVSTTQRYGEHILDMENTPLDQVAAAFATTTTPPEEN